MCRLARQEWRVACSAGFHSQQSTHGCARQLFDDQDELFPDGRGFSDTISRQWLYVIHGGFAIYLNKRRLCDFKVKYLSSEKGCSWVENWGKRSGPMSQICSRLVRNVCVCVCVCMCVCHFVRGRNLIHDCRTYVVPSMCVWNSKTLMHCQCSFYFNPPQSQ